MKIENEKARFSVVKMNIKANRTVGLGRNEEDIILEFGYKSTREYWAAAMSEPMTVHGFEDFLLSHLYGPNMNPVNHENTFLEWGYDEAIQLALASGEPWLIRNRLTPAPEDGTIKIGDFMVKPRPAAEWLLSLPKRRHLVPQGLQEFLLPGYGSRIKLLERATRLRDYPELARHICLNVIFSENRVLDPSCHLSEEELFGAAYGDSSGTQYWEAYLSEPMQPKLLAELLARHSGLSFGSVPLRDEAIVKAIGRASDPELPGAIKLTSKGEIADPRAAVQWLIDRPKRRHLVPNSLLAYMRPVVGLTDDAPEEPVPAAGGQQQAETSLADAPIPETEDRSFDNVQESDKAIQIDFGEPQYPKDIPPEYTVLGPRKADQDWPMLTRMRALIKRHPSLGIQSAAKQVSKDRNRTSRVDRLADWYSRIPWETWEM